MCLLQNFVLIIINLLLKALQKHIHVAVRDALWLCSNNCVLSLASLICLVPIQFMVQHLFYCLTNISKCYVFLSNFEVKYMVTFKRIFTCIGIQPTWAGLYQHHYVLTLELGSFKNKFKKMFIIIWFAIWRLNKYIWYGKGFLKSRRPPKV